MDDEDARKAIYDTQPILSGINKENIAVCGISENHNNNKELSV